MTDLTKDVCQALVAAKVGLEFALEGLVLPLGMVGNKQRILVGGMVFEVGVERVAPLRPERIEQPGKLVVAHGEKLRDQATSKQCSTLVAAMLSHA